MKFHIFSLFLLTSILSFGQEVNKADKILGVYQTQNKDAKIQFYKKGDKYYGKVIWISQPKDADGNPILDRHNPNKTLRKNSVLNLITIRNLSYEDGEWVGGTIYDPKNGKTYDCILWLENGKLKVRGYVGWFYDTKTWTKVN